MAARTRSQVTITCLRSQRSTSTPANRPEEEARDDAGRHHQADGGLRRPAADPRGQRRDGEEADPVADRRHDLGDHSRKYIGDPKNAARAPGDVLRAPAASLALALPPASPIRVTGLLVRLAAAQRAGRCADTPTLGDALFAIPAIRTSWPRPSWPGPSSWPPSSWPPSWPRPSSSWPAARRGGPAAARPPARS